MRKIALLLILPLLISCQQPENNMTLPPPPSDQGGNSGDNPDPGTDPTPDPTPVIIPGIDHIIVGYAYRTSGALPNPNLVTHINFAFGKIDESNYEKVSLSKEKAARLKKIVDLKNDNPNLKVLLSIGGDGAGGFSEMAASAQHRKGFCQSCLDLVDNYKLDGIDIDWEFPTQTAHGRITGTPADIQNFTLLIQELREALGNDKLLTVATEASAKYMDFKSIIQYLDFVNIMSYCMGCPPKNHNSALYPYSGDRMNCESSVAKHFEAGVPYDKMVLGTAFFGEEADWNEIDFRNIDYSGRNVCWDSKAMVPYLTDASGTMVLSYDNELSIGLKADFVKEKGLLGAMYWSLEADDDNWTLSKAIASRLIGWGDPSAEPQAVLATNEYVEKYLEEVDYGDTDYTYSLVTNYPGGGPSENNIELPPTYTISWTASATNNQILRVWEGSWSREYKLSAGVGQQTITNLVPNATYMWMVTAGAGVVGSGKFTTKGRLHQVYFQPDVRNGRDLGGWKGLNGKTIAYHKLYRGGRIDKDYCNETGRSEMLAERILAEVDLREAKYVPSSSPLGSNIAFYAPGFDEGYNEMVKRNPDKVKDTFMWVVARLREGKPVYFHCAAGRDRTATLAILLEGVLGMSESDMAKDYELTYFTPADWGMSKDDNGNPIYKHMRTSYSYGSVRETIFEETESGTYSERITKYLLKIGVPQKDIDDLRAMMLE